MGKSALLCLKQKSPAALRQGISLCSGGRIVRVAHVPFDFALQREIPRHAFSVTRVFLFDPSYGQVALLCLKQKSPAALRQGISLCSGGRIRTSDLWVMSPTSCHCSTPQYIIFGRTVSGFCTTSDRQQPLNFKIYKVTNFLQTDDFNKKILSN